VSGNVVPLENYTIPEGSELILTVLDSDVSFNTLSRQQNAINEFLNGIRNSDEHLGDEFDAILSQRVNIARSIDL